MQTERHPQKKGRADLGIGTAADVAPLLAWLASERSAGVTGQCIGSGGDRLSLWSHPAEAAFDIRPGGWTAEEIDARGSGRRRKRSG